MGDIESLRRDGEPDLALTVVTAAEPRALLVFVHGFGEHIGRYQEVFAAFPDDARVGFDLRGHGQSKGRRGHVDRFADYRRDLAAVVALAQARVPGVPTFLIAHSMGGLIALDYVGQEAPDLAGLVLSSPALAFRYVPPLWERCLARLATRFVPTATRPARIDIDRLSHDPRVAAAVRADSAAFDFASVRWYTECRDAQARVMGASASVRLPSLFLIAGDDALVRPEVTRDYFQALGSEDKTWQDYPDAYHELFQEVGREAVFAIVRDWSSMRLDSCRDC